MGNDAGHRKTAFLFQKSSFLGEGTIETIEFRLEHFFDVRHPSWLTQCSLVGTMTTPKRTDLRFLSLRHS
jgi:hypothetical protein